MANKKANITQNLKNATAIKRRVSPALSRIAARAVTADAEEIRTYAPRELDIQIAEVLLSGELPAVSFKAIAECLSEQGTEVVAQTISKALKNPVSCGWIFGVVHKEIKHRLGMVDASMFIRATSGDTRAASLLYKRYGELVDRHEHTHTGDFNVSALGDKDLDALIKSKGATEADFEVVDADKSGKHDPSRQPGEPDDARTREQQSGFRDHSAPVGDSDEGEAP